MDWSARATRSPRHRSATPGTWSDSPRTFRVIAPDTRAAGGTRHPGGPASATLLCDDVAALIQALGLERPLVAGFSEGGLTALLLGIRHPDAVGAIVSDAGYDMLNPDAPAFGLLQSDARRR